LLTLSLKNKRGLSLTETIFLSVLFHAAFLFSIPSLNLQDTILPMELNIDILINQPEQIKEVLLKPELKTIQKIKSKEPLPIKEIVKPEPKAQTIEPKPISLPKPKNNTASSVINETIESYSTKLTKAIARQKKYPRIAQMRGWQGEIVLNLEIDGQGNLIKSTVKKKSGFKVLDTEGINMVKRASPFPKPPKGLESRIFNVTVPISFKLQQ